MLDELAIDPVPLLHRLRRDEPVVWIDEMSGYLVTSRRLVLAALRDPDRFTVDHPAFTTSAVLGPTMLSLDGPPHARRRQAFARPFRPGAVRRRAAEWLPAIADGLVAEIGDPAELRSAIAGPLAVETILRFLGMSADDPSWVRGWYDALSQAITDLTIGQSGEVAPDETIAEVHRRAIAAMERPGTLLSDLAAVSDADAAGGDEPLDLGQIAAEVGVVLFGAIETAEGMTASAFWHLLTEPGVWAMLRRNPDLIGAAVEESVRLEPAAAFVDRYTTAEVTLGGVAIPADSLVRLSLTAANRDPDAFADPDRFDLHRTDRAAHLAFANGPHVCLGVHLTRAETIAAVDAAVRLRPGLTIDRARSTAPSGLVFRRPDEVWVTG